MKGGSRSMKERTYIAIDLKSFYASVECRERGLDPMDTNLVVADESRTDKTICLAVTPSLKSYGISGRGRLFEVKQRVKEATAGIGTNLFLCKVAMDIVAKHIPADENGVRIAELDEMSYRKTLWAHQPLTDFWRVGRGIAKKLEENGMFTMGDVARCSVHNEDKLYKLFGKNAELLIDHACV